MILLFWGLSIMKTFSKKIQYDDNKSDLLLKPNFCLKNLSYIQSADTPSWNFPMHAHEKGVEITVVLKGKAVVYVDNNIHEIREDDVLIVNEQVTHAEIGDDEEPIEQISMLFDGIQYRDFPGNCLLDKGINPVVRTPYIHLIRSMAFHIRYLCIQQSDTSTLLQVCRALVETLSSNLPASLGEHISYKEYHHLNRVREYIDQNYNKNLSLEDTADRFHINPYYLAHKFKDITGLPFRQYIINRRMGEAEKLLLFEDMKAKDVAKLVGYDSLEYFFYSFKKYVGCTPTEFKLKYKSSAESNFLH